MNTASQAANIVTAICLLYAVGDLYRFNKNRCKACEVPCVHKRGVRHGKIG